MTQQVADKQTWENFIASRPEANFLQSWNWKVFQEKLGKEAYALKVSETAGAVVVVEQAKRGTYLTVAGGPLYTEQKDLSAISTELKLLANQHQASFVRVRPQKMENAETVAHFRQLGYKPSPMHVTADLTLQLDLTKSAETLLAEMRKNTRYEVRRAEKLGITVTQTQDPQAIQRFYEDQLYLAEKHGFVPFSYDFWFHQFKIFAADDQAVLFDAWQDGQRLASAFIIFYNGEAAYHYGTSTPANEKLPGSYACQWAAIQAAKERGCTRYNLWGIAPKEQANHRFAGVSTFKRGFGGEEVQYLPAQDLPTGWLYPVIQGFESLRRRIRRL